ncbi:hypothetical protein MTO96_008659 [Rhipicephalus appendiculatus]
MDRPPQLSDRSPSAFLEKELPRIYDEVRINDRESSGQILKKLQASFFTDHKEDGESNEQYLDIGCGPGNFTCHYLLSLCPKSMRRLVAADNSYPMIDYARREHWPPEDRTPDAWTLRSTTRCLSSSKPKDSSIASIPS